MARQKKQTSGFGDRSGFKRSGVSRDRQPPAFASLSSLSDKRRSEQEAQAIAMIRGGMLAEAEAILRNLLKDGVGSFLTYSNLGALCLMGGRYAEAIHFLREALEIDPNAAAVLSNLGIALRSVGDLNEAIDFFTQALRLEPEKTKWSIHAANARIENGDLETAMAILQEVLTKDPDYPQAHWQLGIVLLMTGRFGEGWKEYEWRWDCEDFPFKRLRTDRPQWNLEDRCDRLLVWGEQGVGDEIMFATLLPEVASLVCHVLVQMDGRLLPLMQRAMPQLQFYPAKQLLPRDSYDHHIPMASLCGRLRPTAASFQRPAGPFLIADRERSKVLRSTLGATGRFLCGISWRSTSPVLGARKSLALPQMASALIHPAVQLISLQYGAVSHELAALKSSAGIDVLEVTSVDNSNDLDGLAALIDACDLVISISNTTVHLAGGLGKPTWVLLHRVPDWRWGLHDEESLWYPSLRLFRQRVNNEWEETLQRVRGQLVDLLAGGCGPVSDRTEIP